jgi:hypothetical protein
MVMLMVRVAVDAVVLLSAVTGQLPACRVKCDSCAAACFAVNKATFHV